jgi:glycosyltransferase involved in cell wall biosynthesis
MQQTPERNSGLPLPPDRGPDNAPAMIARILTDLAHQPQMDPQSSAKLLGLVKEFGSQPDSSLPFLSVLLRTQGNRLEPLKDALLCLAAQTDDDFELVLLVHDADEDATTAIAREVAGQPADFAARISVIDVTGGTRGTPLNEGLRAARGSYIAVYDDDDLVFAHWVEEFHRLAADAGGRVLRAVTATQSVAPETWPSGQSGFRTSSWPAAEYPKTFDLLEHFRVNQTPFMSLAFPAVVFSRLGLTFDERLAVCEDWDIILRASLFCGVEDAPVLTSIYRRWAMGNSSYTDHSTSSWKESEARVVAKMNSRPIVLPPGSVEQIRLLLADREAYGWILASRAWRLARPLRGAVRIAIAARGVLRAARSGSGIRSMIPRRAARAPGVDGAPKRESR